MNQVVIATFYKFVSLPDQQEWRPVLEDFCVERGVRGTILLAREGVNGTVAGSRAGIDAVLAHLRSDARLSDLEHRESYAGKNPFYRMRVKSKKQIVKIGRPEADPRQKVGTHVEPQAWNALISDPEVLVIDTRNDFEVQVGSFVGARNPHTESFGRFPDFVRRELNPHEHKKIAMFCTGGIRCEKATAFLLAQGFEEVYHLKGGILNYLEKIPAEESLWRGECFVFDNRVTLDHNLAVGSYGVCYGCKMPVSPAERRSPHYQAGVSCPHCYADLTPERRASLEERQRQVELARARGEVHIGRPWRDASRAKEL